MAGELKNLPNRAPVIFEAEWNGEGEIPPNTKLIRQSCECPEKLAKKIRDHYRQLKIALTTGENLNSYFADTEKWADVWNVVIANGVAVVLPAVFKGDLLVGGSAKLDALTKVGGYLWVDGSAKLDAPNLNTVNGKPYNP